MPRLSTAPTHRLVRAARALVAFLGPARLGYIHDGAGRDKRVVQTAFPLGHHNVVRAWRGETDEINAILDDPRVLVLDFDATDGGRLGIETCAQLALETLQRANYQGAALGFATRNGAQCFVWSRYAGDLAPLRQLHGQVIGDRAQLEVLGRCRIPAQSQRSGFVVADGRLPTVLDHDTLIQVIADLSPWEALPPIRDIDNKRSGQRKRVSTGDLTADVEIIRNLLPSGGDTHNATMAMRSAGVVNGWPLGYLQRVISAAIDWDDPAWRKVHRERYRSGGAERWVHRMVAYGYPEPVDVEHPIRPTGSQVDAVQRVVERVGVVFDIGPRVLVKYLPHACAHLARAALVKSWEFSLGWQCIAATLGIDKADPRHSSNNRAIRNTRRIVNQIIGHTGMAQLVKRAVPGRHGDEYHVYPGWRRELRRAMGVWDADERIRPQQGPRQGSLFAGVSRPAPHPVTDPDIVRMAEARPHRPCSIFPAQMMDDSQELQTNGQKKQGTARAQTAPDRSRDAPARARESSHAGGSGSRPDGTGSSAGRLRAVQGARLNRRGARAGREPVGDRGLPRRRVLGHGGPAPDVVHCALRAHGHDPPERPVQRTGGTRLQQDAERARGLG